MSEKPNYYGIIPANVRYDKDLRANAKLLYSELTCLTTKEGYCFASNNYFAELYDVDPSAISKWIKQLSDKGYISVEYIYNGKECKERRISINQGVLPKEETGIAKSQQVLPKEQEGIAKCQEGYCQKNKDNNTSNNIINNNNINICKKNRKQFIPPTLEEIKAYIQEKKYSVDAQYFYDYYTVGNWKNKKGEPVKDWKRTLLTWNRNSQNYQNENQNKPKKLNSYVEVYKPTEIPTGIDVPF